jgi:hypothetical protein
LAHGIDGGADGHHRHAAQRVLGLRWHDVDLDVLRLSVNRGLVSVAYELHETVGKTRHSRRTIDRLKVAHLDALGTRLSDAFPRYSHSRDLPGFSPLPPSLRVVVGRRSAHRSSSSGSDVMRTAADPTTDSVAAGRRSSGAAVEVLEVTQTTQGRTTLHDVSFSVATGEVVAIVGGSGAGKTTLLETMVGIRRPAAGEVCIAGVHGRSDIGYVPQDDIIHRDLPLARTLRYAAQLRLPADTAPDAVDRTVVGPPRRVRREPGRGVGRAGVSPRHARGPRRWTRSWCWRTRRRWHRDR